MEGFMIQGMDSPATASCVARGIEAPDFKEAVRIHYTDKKGELDQSVNLEQLTFWGCSLYPDEASARKSFG